MKYQKDYRLTSPANREELNEFNKFVSLVINIQEHSTKGQRNLSFVKGAGKSLICGGLDDG
jgi:hypothetical protein